MQNIESRSPLRVKEWTPFWRSRGSQSRLNCLIAIKRLRPGPWDLPLAQTSSDSFSERTESLSNAWLATIGHLTAFNHIDYAFKANMAIH